MSFEPADIRRALIVEDEDLPRWTLRRLLEEAGWEVTEAPGCEEAETLWSGSRFDLVVTDYRLADGLGTDLVARMRRQGCSTRVILLSAETVADGLAVELKLETVLRKPVEPAVLREAIRSASGAPDTGMKRRTAGRFLIAVVTGNLTAESLSRAIPPEGDGAWVALDCGNVTATDAGATDALVATAGRLRARGGTLCMVGLTGSARVGLDATCREQGIDQVETVDELEALGRRLVSLREREQVLGSVVSQ